MRLKDMTIVKFMLSAILVAMVGIYLLVDLGMAKLSIKATILGANILGGLIFGIGWAMSAIAPPPDRQPSARVATTAFSACWNGSRGRSLRRASRFSGDGPDLGQPRQITIPGALGVNHWIVIVVLTRPFSASSACSKGRDSEG